MDNNADVSESERAPDSTMAIHPVREYIPLTEPPLGHDAEFVRLKRIYNDPVDGDELVKLWNRLSTQDYAFDDFTAGNIEAFASMFVNGNGIEHFWMEEAGYFHVRNAWPGSDCIIHFCVWDRAYPFKRITEASVEMLDYVFRKKLVNRVSGFVPVYNRLAIKFVTLMGFRFEGEMRESVKFKGKYHNVSVYGLLKKDWEKRV